MDAPMRSLCGRTVPGGAVGILPAFMMVVLKLKNKTKKTQKNPTFFKIITEEGRWWYFFLTFLEST